MAIQQTMPTSNITANDIRDTLNYFGGTVDNSLASWFKATANINPWSKYKPVKRADEFCQDISSNMPNYVQNWWKGDDGLCGLDIYISNSYQNVINYIKANGGLFKYKVLSDSDPKRMGDFARYNPEAENPYYQILNKTLVLNNEAAYITMYKAPSDLLTLDLFDISDFADWSLGFIICNPSGTPIKGICAPDTLSNSQSIPVLQSTSIFTSGEGEYICYPMLVNTNLYNKTSLSNWNTNYKYAIVNQRPFVLTVVEATDILLSATAYYSYKNNIINAITFEVRGTNKTKADVSVGNITTTISFLDPDANREVEVYKITEYVDEKIPAEAEEYEFRNIGGSISVSLLEEWHDGFEYYVSIESDNTMIKPIKVTVR